MSYQKSAISTPNAAATVTIAAATHPRRPMTLLGVTWSYSGTPTGGRVSTVGLESGGEVDIDITTGGPGQLAFRPLRANAGLVVTLAAGGSGVVGKLSVAYELH